MKKSEKRMILILVIVAVIAIAVFVIVRRGDASGMQQNAGGQTSQSGQMGEANKDSDLVEKLKDGTKLNISDKLSETKTFGNYEVSNIQLTEKNGESLILADVKNIGSTKKEMKFADIKLVDKEGNEITTLQAVIGEVEPGATVQLQVSATTDFSDAYDFSIVVNE